MRAKRRESPGIIECIAMRIRGTVRMRLTRNRFLMEVYSELSSMSDTLGITG